MHEVVILDPGHIDERAAKDCENRGRRQRLNEIPIHPPGIAAMSGPQPRSTAQIHPQIYPLVPSPSLAAI